MTALGAASPEKLRGRVPAVAEVHAENVAAALGDGLVDAGLKDLCARLLAEDDDVVLGAEDPARFTARERAALAWTQAIAWDAERLSDEDWAALHTHFSEPQLVELGYAIAFMFGQQRWLRTMGLTPEH